MVSPDVKTTSIKRLPISEGVPILKNVPGMLKDPLAHFYQKEQALGHTFENPVPGKRIIATSDPAFIQHVLQKNHRNYKKGSSYKVLKLLLGNGLVSSNGQFWQNQRRLAQPAFHRQNLETLFQDMGITAKGYLDGLAQRKTQEVDIAKEMMGITAQIALKSLFSDTLEEDLEAVYSGMTETMRYVVDSVNLPYSKYLYKLNGRTQQFYRDKEVIDRVVLAAIEKRRNSSKAYPDLLQMFLDATDESTNTQMDDQQLKDELITMFTAGHETSANALSWTLYLLSQHPGIVAKIRQEIAQTVGDKLPGFQDLRQLSYTKQVIDEGMRIFPPVWGIARTAIEEDEFQGLPIHPEDVVTCLIYNLHRSPSIYPDPERFDPDRFAPDQVKARPKLSFVPFGAGPRMCIGSMFATMEMQLILVGILQRFDLELVAGQKIEPEALITLRPKYGIQFRLKVKGE